MGHCPIDLSLDRDARPPNDAAILKGSGARVIAQPPTNIESLAWADEFDLGLHGHTTETLNSQLEKSG